MPVGQKMNRTFCTKLLNDLIQNKNASGRDKDLLDVKTLLKSRKI